MSGALTEVFVRLADHESREAQFRSHIVSSMIYPVLLGGGEGGSMFVMMYVVVPRFGEVFATTGIHMPASTALLMSFADAVRNYVLYLLILGAAAGYMIARWLRTEAGRRRLDRLMVSLPLIGDFVRKAETARLARTMATRWPVRVWALPGEAPQYDVRMVWHATATREPGHAWLRDLVRRLFRRAS